MSDHTPTFADICSAIAEGSIAATLDGAAYQVSIYELRRYFDRSRSLPASPTSDSRVSLAINDRSNWSAFIQTFVA